MVVVSTLRLANAGQKLLQTPLFRAGASALVTPAKSVALQPVRQMGGHKKTYVLKPSNYEWRAWKDLVHYYVALAAIPIVGLITYANLVEGQAVLSDIPDDYEPEYWEYYKHPITRMFVRLFHDKPEKVYEVNLHYINHENEKRKMRILEKKVKQLMAERQDVRAWNFTPVNSEQTIYAGYEDRQVDKSTMGKRG